MGEVRAKQVDGGGMDGTDVEALNAMTSRMDGHDSAASLSSVTVSCIDYTEICFIPTRTRQSAPDESRAPSRETHHPPPHQHHYERKRRGLISIFICTNNFFYSNSLT